MAAMQLTRTHRILVGVVVAGAVVIAGIGFAGSYAAVRELAVEKGFGNFSYVLPIGIDAGICVLLALDLLLTWIRIPFPLLRQTAWLLTAATIAFNGAAAWPDPLGVGMHAVIPVLFVVSVEAARHAIGRIADITADRHMEGVRLTRWLLSPVPTFVLWRRMKLWELRSYEQVIKLEQERLVYRARLRSRFGRAWRRKAPVESLMPLRLARYGVPLAQTAPSGLAAAGIEPTVIPGLGGAPGQPADGARQEVPARETRPELTGPAAPQSGPPAPRPAGQQPQPQPQARTQAQSQARAQEPPHAEVQDPAAHTSPWFAAPLQPAEEYAGGYDPQFEPPYDPREEQGGEEDGARFNPRFDAPYQPRQWYEQEPPQDPAAEEEQAARADRAGVRVPAGPHRTRPLGEVGARGRVPGQRGEQDPAERAQRPGTGQTAQPLPEGYGEYGENEEFPGQDEESAPAGEQTGRTGLPEDMSREEAYYGAFRQYRKEVGEYPNARQFGLYLMEMYGVTGRSGDGPLSESTLVPQVKKFRLRHQEELDTEFSA
ncbi:DUF2637 domain-containing protein [Streptomyces sp. NPDC007088]|uniref:DUF2637 domain-containing protein n=1 Tax=Streptomyces sp. NPDC007088 TaxID=3364773 RepID=UPI00367715A3